jgi:hypothetical protein
MGVVWSAWDQRLERPVAMKHIRVDTQFPELRQRLLREARAAARLNHSAIVHIYDLAETADGDWIVMELVEGKTLHQLLEEKGFLPFEQAIHLCRHVAEGLAEAHRHDILHRDLKASNVMVTPKGQAKILDFGLAKQLHRETGHEAPEAPISTPGLAVGTCHAMSPEQVLGHDLDARSDLFALGSLLYEMLTGKPPFEAESAAATYVLILDRQPPPLLEACPGAPRELSNLVSSLLEKNPDARPKSAEEVASRLAGLTAVAKEPASHIARPGAPIPERAVNRIRRSEDKQLLTALDDAPFTAAIVGPPECGKTTALQLLIEEARRRGFAIVDFDARMIPEPVEVKDDSEKEVGLSERFLPELALEVCGAIHAQLPKDLKTARDLVRFLKDERSRRPAPPLLIAVDHIEVVSLAVETLVQVCRTLDAQKGRTQMSWLLEAGNLTAGHQLTSLSRLAPSPMIEMGWFSKDQVKGFAGIYEVQDDDIVEYFWNCFLGQPSLIHIAMHRLRSLSAIRSAAAPIPSEVLREEIQLAVDDFGRHLRRRQDHLLSSHFWKEFKPLPSDVSTFLADCEKDRAKRLLAERFGLLRPNTPLGLKPQMPSFYQKHFAALQAA